MFPPIQVFFSYPVANLFLFSYCIAASLDVYLDCLKNDLHFIIYSARKIFLKKLVNSRTDFACPTWQMNLDFQLSLSLHFS